MGRGFGTEKIEDQITEIFPEAKIARMDLDTTRTRNAYERLIADFSEGRTNLLIGTQMVSKGLDFDKVSVVGILNADSFLRFFATGARIPGGNADPRIAVCGRQALLQRRL